ncbi:hypothetical protein [Actinoplanes siamensis]|uniref:Uncharacterized protein n=1 Tax=Actinoplanes siamensis TaxID=1223317 RepID=A0A919TKF5_9ACTN|nr:hypothetical protein [Actinoplanes siamensis]GIF05527.1 hypothetical protein Asi03nite_30650 [Actinoplanes siamensis]
MTNFDEGSHTPDEWPRRGVDEEIREALTLAGEFLRTNRLSKKELARRRERVERAALSPPAATGEPSDRSAAAVPTWSSAVRSSCGHVTATALMLMLLAAVAWSPAPGQGRTIRPRVRRSASRR